MKYLTLIVLSIFMSGCHLTFRDYHQMYQDEHAKLGVSEQKLNSATETVNKANQLVEQEQAKSKQLDTVLTTKNQLAQEASNAVAGIKAVQTIDPVDSRRETVITQQVETASKALPTPTNYADIIKQMREKLDTTITSNEKLEKQHKDDLARIDKLNQDLTAEQTKYTQLSTEFNTSKENYKKQVEQLDTELKVQAGKVKTLALSIANTVAKFKYFICGLLLITGLILTIIGSLVSNIVTTTKGVIVVIAAIIGLLVPVEVYMGILGLLIITTVSYIIYHWKKNDTIAKNAVGIIEEAKGELSPEAKAKIKEIAQSYWGTSEKEVAKADAWITEKLKKLNLK